MPHHHQTLFSSLPYEIFQHILSFGVDKELNNPASRKSDIRMAAIFQSISKRISSMNEMQDYFNTFWWTVLEKNFVMPAFEKELEQLKSQMIKKGDMKRKILLASFIKFKVWKRPKYDPSKGSEEVKVVVLGQGGVG